MNFLNYLQHTQDINEAVIVPPKLNIKTNDIKKLNRQFKDTIISFKYDEGEHAAYRPELDEIVVYITPDTPHHVIEALLQHELIHQIQDERSGMRMQADIEAQYNIVKGYLKELDDLDDTDEVDPDVASEIMGKIKKAQIKAQHLNDEERMTYSAMFIKLRSSNNIKQIVKEANEHWIQFTGEKMNKKMLKYLYSYWLIRDKF